jgi:hypothetical protein
LEIPEELKKELLSELEFIIKKMAEETDVSRKMYFFTATYGAIGRVLRYHSNNELTMAHALLTICYNTLNDRINRLKEGYAAVPLPENWSEQLIDYLSEFKKAIQENRSTYPALEKITRLSYMATGAGYYDYVYLDSLKSRESSQEG